MSLNYFSQQGDVVLAGVFILLVGMSVLSWYFIINKLWRMRALQRQNRQFTQEFWAAANLETAQASAWHSISPLARLAVAGIVALRHFRTHGRTRIDEACSTDEFLLRAIRNSLRQENARLESGLTVLASIGSIAPFIGLFGTVWGIYRTLIGISAAGSGALDTVAGPMGEALVATAAGLAVAIPAVLAYNTFLRSGRKLMAEMDAFAHDLHAYLTTGASLAAGSEHAPRPAAVAVSKGVA